MQQWKLSTFTQATVASYTFVLMLVCRVHPFIPAPVLSISAALLHTETFRVARQGTKLPPMIPPLMTAFCGQYPPAPLSALCVVHLDSRSAIGVTRY
jgi:uncharacterized membrane protein YdjX (TVP38/TMEM64 family)